MNALLPQELNKLIYPLLVTDVFELHHYYWRLTLECPGVYGIPLQMISYADYSTWAWDEDGRFFAFYNWERIGEKPVRWICIVDLYTDHVYRYQVPGWVEWLRWDQERGHFSVLLGSWNWNLEEVENPSSVYIPRPMVSRAASFEGRRTDDGRVLPVEEPLDMVSLVLANNFSFSLRKAPTNRKYVDVQVDPRTHSPIGRCDIPADYPVNRKLTPPVAASPVVAEALVVKDKKAQTCDGDRDMVMAELPEHSVCDDDIVVSYMEDDMASMKGLVEGPKTYTLATVFWGSLIWAGTFLFSAWAVGGIARQYKWWIALVGLLIGVGQCWYISRHRD